MSHTIAQTRRNNPMWFYEQNYLLLLAIIPGLKSPQLSGHTINNGAIQMAISVAEVSPYTCLLTLAINFDEYTQITPIQMKVRIYHDASLAEVVAYQQINQLMADFLLQPTPVMDVDNKRQANLLLHEALNYYIKHEHQNDEVVC